MTLSIGKILFFSFLGLALVLLTFFFIGTPPRAEEIKWGVNFSHKHASGLGLDWKETYLALLDDLKVRRIRLITHWDELELEEGRYDFRDLDWQIEEAEKRDAELVLVVGMKTPRWPECHIPAWANGLSQEKQQKKVLQLVEKTVLRYRDSPAIERWQAENEPFFPFGDCPWADQSFIKKEIGLIKSLDHQGRPVLISDSGEGSFWWSAARLGDIVGITTYKKVWVRQMGFYLYYPLPEIYYYRKAWLVSKLFGKKVIGVELQAEPWGPRLLYNSPLAEQEKTMNLEQFRRVINFARGMGLDEFYLWGSEWWFWLRERQDDSSIWNEAKELFAEVVQG